MKKVGMDRDRFTLLCNGTPFLIDKRRVSTLLTLFSNNPSLLKSGSYKIQSNVTPEIFADFCRAAQGERIELNSTNVFNLFNLSEELGFTPLCEQCQEFVKSQEQSNFTTQISNIEERLNAQEREVISLQTSIARLAELETSIAQLKHELDGLKSSSVSTQKVPKGRCSVFRDRKIQWFMQLSDSQFFEICWGTSSDSESPFSCTICSLKSSLPSDSDHYRFTERLTKVAAIRSPVFLEILGFSANEKFTGLPTIFYEFCGTETVDIALHQHSLSITNKLIIISGIVSALQQFEEAGLPIGHLSLNHILLNDHREPKLIGCGLPLNESQSQSESQSESESLSQEFIDIIGELFPDRNFGPFLQELCEKAVNMRMSDIMRTLMAEGFIPADAENGIVREYQSRIMPTKFLQKTVSELYQRCEFQTIQCNELNIAVENVEYRLSNLSGELNAFRNESKQNHEISGQWNGIRDEFKEMKYSLKCFFDSKTRFEFPVSFTLNGIFGYLITSQQSPFERNVITSQSSGDLYRLIDPNSTDNFSSGAGDCEWIQFEFPEPISIVAFKLKSAHRSFLKTWSFFSIDRHQSRTELFSAVDDNRLNGDGNEVIIDIKATRSTTFRLEKYGTNWQDSNFFRLKNIELFSDEPRFIGGVFQTLVGQSHDCHRVKVLLTSSNFDFQSFHLLSPHKSMCTLSDEEPPWIQFELSKGSAIVQGYRLEHVNDHLFNEYSLQGSNDFTIWTIIDRRNEPPTSSSLRVCQCKNTLAFRYFRLIYEVKQSAGTAKLRIRHFDIFGIYLDVPHD
jgi:hypothetical protein